MILDRTVSMVLWIVVCTPHKEMVNKVYFIYTMRAKLISLASVSTGLKNLCNQNFLCSLKVCELFSAYSLLSLVHSYAAFLLVGRVCGGGVGMVGHEYAIAQITIKSLYIFLIQLID